MLRERYKPEMVRPIVSMRCTGTDKPVVVMKSL